MYFSWPLTEFSLHDVILETVELSYTKKNEIIESIGINYALDTIFIFSWVASWFGLFLYFKSLNIKLIGLYFGLSLLGAILDITENSISFSLLIGNYENPENFVLLHSIVRDISYWLPMLASFMLLISIPKHNGITFKLLKFTGIIGVLFAIPGMYIHYFSAIPEYWFGLWFLSAGLFLVDCYRKENRMKTTNNN